MSEIPVYTQSPINAVKAEAVTPQTAAPAPTRAAQYGPSTNIATTTAVPLSTTPYAPARPGAPAMPAPTSAAQKYVPVQPTPTTNIGNDEPPAPQPGAVPTPSNVRSNLPPSPKAGENPTSPASQTSTPQSYPPQMKIPPPTSVLGAQPPSSSTGTTTISTTSYPVAVPPDNFDAPGRSLENPPGYVQNPYASNMSADQRRAQESQNMSDTGNHDNDKSNSTAAFSMDPENVWDTAKSWASTAGKKLSEAESEIWKRVNREK